jgi:hypothetical protein
MLASVWLVGKPKISEASGQEALRSWRDGAADDAATALAIRFSLQQLALIAPGKSVEVRVPPYGAVQVIEGPSHTRGTPPAVVETSPAVWLALVLGDVTFSQARERSLLKASGERSDLSALLPLWLLPLEHD